MSDQSPILKRDDTKLSVLIDPSALELKEEALASASLIRIVENETQQNTAVEAGQEIKVLLDKCEASRKQVKEPVLDLGRSIDKKAAEFEQELRLEYDRITKLLGNYQALLASKKRDAEALAKFELDAHNRKVLEETAKATHVDQVQEIRERAAQEQQAIERAHRVEVPVAKGQTVKPDWEITVDNYLTLATNHPECVTITEKIGAIKNLLAAGKMVKGVTAKPITKSQIRAPRGKGKALTAGESTQPNLMLDRRD